MYIEYSYKLNIIKKLLGFESNTDFGIALGANSKNSGNNLARTYLIREVIPSEKTVEQICEYLDMSYDFFSNYCYNNTQHEQFALDLIWTELSHLKGKILKYNPNDSLLKTKPKIIFKPTSPVITKYINEIINKRIIDDPKLSQNNIHNIYYKYLFNFPYSSEVFEKDLFNFLKPKSALNSDYLIKNRYFLEYFKERITKDKFLDELANDNSLLGYINVNYKVQALLLLQKDRKLESFEKFNKEKYYGELKFNPNKKILSSTVTVKQAELLEDALQTPLCRFVDTYDKNYEHADLFMNSLVWSDIFNNSFTLEKVSSNDEGYYFESNDINNYLKKYFNYQEKYINDANYIFNDYALDILRMLKVKTLNDICSDIKDDEILLEKITQIK